MRATRRATLAVAATLLAVAAAGCVPHGYGPGMMGPGMTGGYGLGPDMMGPGYGMGPGMMGGYGYAYGLDLSPEQRTRMSEIQQGLARQRWDLVGKMHQQGYRAMDLYRDGKLDEEAARKNYGSVSAAHDQMFESWLQAQKEMDALLTPEQRRQLQSRWRGR